MDNKIVKRYSLSKQVSDKLEKMIEAGEYRLGEKIPTESELMVQFDVSRNTVREAIQSLTSAGVLVVKQGDGTYVKSNNRFTGYMNLKYEQVSIEDVRETRNTLEITIAKLAAMRRTDEDMAEIMEMLKKRNVMNGDSKENTESDFNFHLAVAKACHNKIFYDLYQSIASFVESHISLRHAETTLNPEYIDALHESLATAIEKGDPDEAAVCAKNILKI